MISYSINGFKTKPQDIPNIEYIRRDLTLDEIVALIMNGHAISANFTKDGQTIIKQKQRNKKNFVDTCFIMFDLDDDVKITLEELNDKLKLKPTICYTTYSHRQAGKGNRYRLLYIFNQPINDIEQYRCLYDSIASINHLNLKDNCGKNCTQNVFGSYSGNTDFTMINNHITYNIKDIPIDESVNGTLKKEGGSIMITNGTLEKSNGEGSWDKVISNIDFMKDYENLTIRELIEKYIGKYPNIEETPLEIPNADTPYILYPTDYIRIKRKWFPYQTTTNSGEIVKEARIKRIRDGEGRKRLLYVNGIVRRLITNDTITFDNLLFNLLYEFYYFYEHKDITKKTIMTISNNVWNTELRKYESMRGPEHRFRVNPRYCEKYGIPPKRAMHIAIKQMTSDMIGGLYDCYLSDVDNIELFRSYGLNVSLSTLKRWRKENGINKYNKGIIN